MVHYERNAVLLDGLPTHLTTPVRRMDDLCPQFLVDLSFISNARSYASVLVKHNRALLVLDDLFTFAFLDDEPFLQVPFPSIKVGLIFRA